MVWILIKKIILFILACIYNMLLRARFYVFKIKNLISKI